MWPVSACVLVHSLIVSDLPVTDQGQGILQLSHLFLLHHFYYYFFCLSWRTELDLLHLNSSCLKRNSCLYWVVKVLFLSLSATSYSGERLGVSMWPSGSWCWVCPSCGFRIYQVNISVICSFCLKHYPDDMGGGRCDYYRMPKPKWHPDEK